MSENRFDALLESIRKSALPVSTVDQDEVQELIIKADLIWGFDPAQDAMPLFYGRELLQDIAKGREAEFGFQMLLCFQLDLNTDEPELLYKTVKALKGSCCYWRAP
jgi:hypothetical protein